MKYNKIFFLFCFLFTINFFLSGCGFPQIKIGQNTYNYDENKPCAKNYHDKDEAYITWVKHDNLSYDSAYNVAMQSITELNLSVASYGQIIFTDKATGIILLTQKFKFEDNSLPDIIYLTTTIIVKKDGNGSIIEIKTPGTKIRMGRAGRKYTIKLGSKSNFGNCIFFEIMDRRLNKA